MIRKFASRLMIYGVTSDKLKCTNNTAGRPDMSIKAKTNVKIAMTVICFLFMF